MDASRATAVVEDSRFRDHRGPGGHPERPERLAAVDAALAERSDRLERLAPRPASPDEILRVHTPAHLKLIGEAAGRAPLRLDADTYVSPQSCDVALLAAGATIDLARAVARGEIRSGFAAVRPPGHHAEAGRAMGFCLFNNVAVAARALRAEDGVERVLILDWDVHHGNGTQHFFEEDPSVLYVSFHQFPFYPGTGDFAEAGRGKGLGATLNVPLPAGCGDLEYEGVARRLLVPAARHFRPEMILVSSGFDAHRDDPLGGMAVSREGFRSLARVVRALADDLCAGRLACVLEGGYADSGLREGTAALLDALLDPAPSPLPPTPDPMPGSD
ncbi:MAG: histone deacetylase family protein, partial [Planctomycetota bacterium]